MRAQALAKLDHLVVQDLFLTETAFHADVVLPASAFAGEGRHLHQHRPARADRAARDPPPGDARQDWWIIQEIARRMGSPGTTPARAEVFAEMAQVDAVA